MDDERVDDLMSDSAIRALVDEYIRYTDWFASTKSKTERIDPPGEFDTCSWEQAFKSPERWWRFIKMACELKMSEQVFSVFAAGPLEDFLGFYGPDYIDEVESLAKQSEKFNALLGGVWKNAIDDEVWIRVKNARSCVW